MLTYDLLDKDYYQVSFGDVLIGVMYRHIAVLSGDKSYWRFDKARGRGKPLELRAGRVTELKMLVEHYVAKLIDAGMSTGV